MYVCLFLCTYIIFVILYCWFFVFFFLLLIITKLICVFCVSNNNLNKNILVKYRKSLEKSSVVFFNTIYSLIEFRPDNEFILEIHNRDI